MQCHSLRSSDCLLSPSNCMHGSVMPRTESTVGCTGGGGSDRLALSARAYTDGPVTSDGGAQGRLDGEPSGGGGRFALTGRACGGRGDDGCPDHDDSGPARTACARARTSTR